MAWSAPRTWAVGEILTAANMNTFVRDNQLELSTHVHDGSAGEGSSSLGPLVQADFTDAAAPAAPGAGKTRLYSVSGRMRSRAGAAGVDSQLVSALDGVANGDILYFNGTSWVRLAIGSASQHIIVSGGIPAWANVSTIALIEERNPSAVTTDTFSSIPGTYQSLLLVFDLYGASGGTITLRFNGVTTGYYWMRLSGDGAAASSDKGDNAGQATLAALGGNSESSPVHGEILFPNYIVVAEPKYDGRVVEEGSTSINAIRQVGGKLNSSNGPITSITLLLSGGTNFSGNAVLYGLPSA